MSEKKIVVNRCYGGFGVSLKALLRLRELGQKEALEEALPGQKWSDGTIREPSSFDSFGYDIPRDDPLLVKVVEEMGADANGACAKLGVVAIPSDVDWEIDSYDGNEHIAEKHRTW